jgi:hypothetical protein
MVRPRSAAWRDTFPVTPRRRCPPWQPRRRCRLRRSQWCRPLPLRRPTKLRRAPLRHPCSRLRRSPSRRRSARRRHSRLLRRQRGLHPLAPNRRLQPYPPSVLGDLRSVRHRSSRWANRLAGDPSLPRCSRCRRPRRSPTTLHPRTSTGRQGSSACPGARATLVPRECATRSLSVSRAGAVAMPRTVPACAGTRGGVAAKRPELQRLCVARDVLCAGTRADEDPADICGVSALRGFFRGVRSIRLRLPIFDWGRRERRDRRSRARRVRGE